ncbi:MAG: endo-1,4-beta-xylanase [Phycisphaerae bacterium]
MNRTAVLSLIAIIMFFVNNCFGAEDMAAKVSPEAIDQRISEIRMGDITVITKPGSKVTVKQTRHEFLFGTAVPDSLAEKSGKPMSADDREKYLQILEQNFNYAVHENALKWYDCEPVRGKVDYYMADRIYELCNERNIKMRGHCIFWEKDEYIMPWLKRLNNDDLRSYVQKRATGVTEHFKGRIEEFDLNNEMVNGTFFRRRLGYGIVNAMAWMAKAGNPNVKLFVNDYGILVEGGYNRSSYIEQIENLLTTGVPIDGIGCQAHFISSLKNDSSGRAETKSTDVQKVLDRLSEFNLPIKITECLFAADTEEGIAEEFNRVFPILFAHPNVEAIIMWGFWAGDHWMPQTAMWKADWTPTPQADAYRELVYKKWWTDTAGAADPNGSFKTRAFYGDYIITADGKEKKVTLSKNDKSINVTFD